MNSRVYDSLNKLCTDICKKNDKKKLLWLSDRSKTLNYTPKSDEMVLTVHRWFANKSCSGDWLYAKLGNLAAKVTAALSTGTGASTDKAVSQLYRVRKTWADSKSQKDAFSVLGNAKKCADSNKSYSVFGGNGKKVYPADASSTKKSVDTIAREVIRGDWGNGDECKQKLTDTGYDYSAVQKKVNELLK